MEGVRGPFPNVRSLGMSLIIALSLLNMIISYGIPNLLGSIINGHLILNFLSWL